MPIGLLTDCIGVLLGGLAGAALGPRLPQRISRNITVVLGFSSMAIGINSIVKASAMTPVVMAVIFGTLLGEVLQMEKHITHLFGKAVCRLPHGEGFEMDHFITVVVLFCGCAVEMPWLDKVKAVLYMGLPGQAGGAAAANLLTGKANPSGKLTETWPLCYDDVPSRDTFGKKTTHYKEGLYAGYRYYDKAGKAVRFPFGYGLSYTQFAYSDLKIEGRTVTAAVTNTGSTAGAEVVQLYVAPPKNGLYRPAKELKGFAKVSLQPGESQTVRFELNDRSFAVWCDGWQIPAGSYEICVGASVADIRLRTALTVDGVSLAAPDWQKGSWYETLQGLPTDAEFEKLCGSPLQSDPEPKKGAFTMEHSTMELKDISAVMMQMFKGTEATIAKSFGGKADYSDPTFKMMVMSGADAPLRAAVLSSCGMFPANLAEGMLAIANGHPLQGVKKMVKK